MDEIWFYEELHAHKKTTSGHSVTNRSDLQTVSAGCALMFTLLHFSGHARLKNTKRNITFWVSCLKSCNIMYSLPSLTSRLWHFKPSFC